MIPAVIYARYSSSNQREESIAGQLRDCHAYAEKNGLRIIKEYTDSAMTATSDKRPSFQRMIKDSEKKRFKMVLVWKLDRFARDRYDAAIYRKRLRENGAKLVSVMEPIADGPEGIILEGMLESMAEYYSANLSENIKRGTYDNALQRKVTGTLPLGYRKGDDGRYAIDEATAPIVQRIFREYTSGRSRAQIIEGLNADGIRTRHGKQFAKSGLYPILKNEKYIGVYRFRDIYDPEGVPAIIDRNTFEEAQRIMQEKSFTKKRTDLGDGTYHLATHVFCGLCGSPMTGESARSKTGKIYRYYSCTGKKTGDCDKERVSKEWLEQSVMQVVNEQILTDEMIEEFVTAYQENIDRIQSQDNMTDLYRQELAETERQIRNINKAIASGGWSRSLSQTLADLEARQEELEDRIREEQDKLPVVTAEMVRTYFLQLREKAKTDSQCQQTLVDVFLRRVYLWDAEKKGQPIKAVFEISLSGNQGTPESYEVMLECSRENNSVEASVHVSNFSAFVTVCLPASL